MLKSKEIRTLNHDENHIIDNKGELDRNGNISGKDRMKASESKIEEAHLFSHFASWKPLGRLPSGSRDINTYHYSNKVNRYLEYQEKRIIQAVVEKKYQKAALIGCILLKNSMGYQLALFNKVMPQGHYLLGRIEARNLITKVINKCRSHDLGLDLRRFYILKADGKRGRPIGCPDYPSRVISRSLNDLIYILFEDKFNRTQHGFRKNRGAFSAIIQIVNKLKQSPKIIYEFDLKSFFNTVRPMGVYRALLARSPLLAEIIYKIIMQIRYKLPSEKKEGQEQDFKDKYVYLTLNLQGILLGNIYLMGGLGVFIGGVISCMILEIGFETINPKTTYLNLKYIDKGVTGKDAKYNIIKPERELRTKALRPGEIHREPLVIESKKGPIEIMAPYITREGLPQGLSISPVLATLAMELFKTIDELVLYADDGVYIGNDMKKFNQGKQDMSLIGAELSEEKSGYVKGRFKFLGCIIDLDREEINYKGKSIQGYDPLFEKKVMTLYVEEPYKKQPKGGNGNIKPHSLTAIEFRDTIHGERKPIGDIILVLGSSIMGGLPHQGYRGFVGCGVIDILGASSYACNEIVKSKSELNLVAIKPLSPIFKGKLNNYCMNKNTYYEEIYENSLRSYIKSELPGGNNVMENYGEL